MSFQAYIDNIKVKTGKSPEDFKKLAEKQGLLRAEVKAGAIVAWLKKNFGLGHGHAMAIYASLKGMKGATGKQSDDGQLNPTTGIRFHTTILQAGKTATGIQIPDDVISKLGTIKKLAVRITINGYTYRSTVAVMGGRFMVSVSAENREKAKVAGGQEVDVDIALDIAPREVTVPADFAAALSRDAKVQKQFDGLSYSKKKAFVQGVDGAKSPETRQRRIDKVVGDLKEAATQA